jgi:hypothetical protein
MRARVRTAAALLAAAMALATAPVVGASTRTTPRSEAGCEAFNDYFQVNFAVAFLTGFAEAFEDFDDADGSATNDQPDIDQLRNVVFLVLSPKLEQSTSVLAKQGPKQLRKVFMEQRAVYRDGSAILQDDLGLSDEQIDAIRDADFGKDTPDALADELGIGQADLEAAADEFGEQSDVLTAEDATASQSRAFERLATGCGSVPDSGVDCDEVVTTDLRDELLGSRSTVESDGGTCTYTGAEEDDGDEPVLGVNVYRTAESYDRLVEQNSAIAAIDADNATIDGYTMFSSFKTCGRTLFSRTGDATVVVALCSADDGDVPDADLTDVRDAVVEELG